MTDSSFDELLESDFGWPTIGDKPFSDRCSPLSAPVSGSKPERKYHMTDGYKMAGDLLVVEVMRYPNFGRKLVYPIIFSYRHYIELTIKSLLENYGHLGDVPPNWSDHDLDRLWIGYSELLRRVERELLDDSGTKFAERCVAQFAKLDPGSFTFRYPLNKRGQLIDIDVGTLDLERVQKYMDYLEGYFAACDLHFGGDMQY